MGKLISLADYRRLRVEGTTLIWRGLRLRLTAREAFLLAEDVRDVLALRGQATPAGFLVSFDGEEFTIEGRDFGPAKLSRVEATSLALALALAVSPVARSIAP